MRRWAVAALAAWSCIAAALSGCAPAAVGAGATGATVAVQERGVSGAIADTGIRAQINHLWFQESERMYRYVNLQVWNRRALLTGVVPEPDMRRKAARLAWQADDVAEVINEIQVDENRADVKAFAKDSWIAAQLKSQILFDTKIKSINYSIETVRGRIFLLGTARSQAELERVIDHARNLGNVKEVVSYVRVAEPADGDDTNGRDANGREAHGGDTDGGATPRRADAA